MVWNGSSESYYCKELAIATSVGKVSVTNKFLSDVVKLQNHAIATSVGNILKQVPCLTHYTFRKITNGRFKFRPRERRRSGQECFNKQNGNKNKNKFSTDFYLFHYFRQGVGQIRQIKEMQRRDKIRRQKKRDN